LCRQRENAAPFVECAELLRLPEAPRAARELGCPLLGDLLEAQKVVPARAGRAERPM